MKKALFAICCLGLVWSGCKEHDTPIDFSSNVFSDTSYVLPSVPAADPREVLIEEFTGQSCPACPSGHTQLEQISGQHPGLINIIGLYITNFSQTRPPTGSTHDFRSETASTIATGIFGAVSQLPIAGIDRVLVSGSLLLNQPDWSTTVNARLALPDSLNISDTSSYDSVSKTITINLRVTYLYPVTSAQYVSIALVEDSMTDIQEDNIAPTGFDNNYLYTNVFRGMATALPQGDLVTSLTAKEAGRVVQKIYKYPLPTTTPAINPAHCRVIAFVSSGTAGDYHVIQSAHFSLK